MPVCGLEYAVLVGVCVRMDMYVYVSVCACIFAVFLHVVKRRPHRKMGGGLESGVVRPLISERPRS